jgi:phage-related protein
MATFTTTPLYAYQRGINHNVLVTEFESGKEQRKYLGVRARTWTVGFRNKVAIIKEIEDFYNARKGSFEAFTWTPPGASSAISVRFEEASLSVSYSGSLYAECEFTLREIL